MARLSEDHHHATTSMATPKSARASGRLRDIFKPRRSTRAGSPKTLTKSAPAAIETEDILPSDRKSLHAPTEELTGDAGGDVKPVDNSEIKGAFDGFSGVQAADRVTVEQPGADSELGGKAEVESVGALSVSTPIHGDLLVEADACSRQKSFVSNIFDDQGSLSAGIREYVESMIAEAFHGHSCDCPARAPLNITAKFELDDAGETSRSSSLKRIPASTNILHSSKRVGRFNLEHSSHTYNLQKWVIGLYLLTVVFSALIGPKNFLIAFWRLSVILLTYSFAGRMFGWHKNARPDLLLVPVQHIAGILHNTLCDVIDQYGVFEVYLNSQIMRESLAEVGAIFEPK